MFEGVGTILRFPFFIAGSAINSVASLAILVFGNLFSFWAVVFGILWLPFAFVFLAFKNDRHAWKRYKEGLKLESIETGFEKRQANLSAWLVGDAKLNDDLGCLLWIVGIAILGLLIFRKLFG